MTKKRMLAMVLVLLMTLPLLLAGCESAPDVPEETVPYRCLPRVDEASMEEMMLTAIEGIKESTGREDEPLGFWILYSAGGRGLWESSGSWNFKFAYEGGDVYAVNMGAVDCDIRTIVLLPDSYYDALDEFYGAGVVANRDAELIYSQNQDQG